MDITDRMEEINDELKTLFSEASKLQELWMLGFKNTNDSHADNVVIGPWGVRSVHNRGK